MMEIMLDSCSRDWAPCHSKVRSLGALQVLLSIGISLTGEERVLSTLACGARVKLSHAMIHSIIATLSQNILSEERGVVEATLANCCMLGANDHGSKAALEVLASKYTVGGRIDSLANDEEFVWWKCSLPHP